MCYIIPLFSELVFPDIVPDCLDVSAKSSIDNKEGLLGVGVDEVAGLFINGVVGVADAVPAVDVQDHVAAKLLHCSSYAASSSSYARSISDT